MPNNNDKNKNVLFTALKEALIIVVLCFFTYCIFSEDGFPELPKKEEVPEIQYEEFLEKIDENAVESIDWSEDKDTITFYDSDENKYSTANPKYEDFKKEMLEHGIEVNETKGLGDYESALMIGINIIVYIVFFALLAKKFDIGGEKPDKKKNKDSVSTVKFDDVAGLEEVKEDLMTVVDFLKNPNQYKEAGAEIPKGVLLYGPPGTGKTLLAKSIAGEAGVKFKSVSGSDFDEKYVGVGAKKMRKMFEDARNNAPCIIFIDEIDSLGGKRHAKQNSYDRQTLNTLLSEMDGFDGREGVVVIAATNRLEDLDPALTRPGRFDNHFAVGLPATSSERKVIINLYSKNKKFAEDVDMEAFAKETMGSSPATIKTVLNEAAIIAARRNNGIINRVILDEAWMKQLLEGHLKKNREKDNTAIVAWHEAGHALAGLLLGQDLTKASIIPSTSGTGGATFITPKKLGLFTKKELEEQVMMLYAGRCAESILVGNESEVTTGASNDIKKATSIINNMITDYGMTSTFGLLNLDDMEVEKSEIYKEAVKMSSELYEKSLKLLTEHHDSLQRIADALIEKETLTGEEIRTYAKL